MQTVWLLTHPPFTTRWDTQPDDFITGITVTSQVVNTPQEQLLAQQ